MGRVQESLTKTINLTDKTTDDYYVLIEKLEPRLEDLLKESPKESVKLTAEDRAWLNSSLQEKEF
jgi:hypothetical protein